MKSKLLTLCAGVVLVSVAFVAGAVLWTEGINRTIGDPCGWVPDDDGYDDDFEDEDIAAED